MPLSTKMQYDGDERQLIRVAKLGPAPFTVPTDSWRAPHGALRGTVRLGGDLYELEPLVCALAQQLSVYNNNNECRRIGIFRIPPCTALALVPALRRVGIAAVWFNDRWSARELRYAFETSRVSLAIIGAQNIYGQNNNNNTFIPANIGLIVVDKLPFPNVRCMRPASLFCNDDTAEEEVVKGDECVYYTSGSGGVPKGVRLAHASMDIQALEKVRRFPFNCNSVYVHLAPHFHVGGASSTLAALHIGARHIFLPFTANLLGRAPQILDVIYKEAVTILVLVPGLLSALVDAAQSTNRILPCVEALIIGGSKTGRDLVAKAARYFPNAAPWTAGTYGMTECASSIALALLGRNELLFARTPWHVELAIVKKSGENRRGRLVTRGPHLMRGYLGSKEEPLKDGGWFETGDIGQVTADGGLREVRRIGDVIRSGGESVDATEVERTISEHTGVSYAAVVGVEDKKLGEAVAAAVTLRSEAATSAEALVGFCKERLAGFKVPRWVFVFDKLPMTAMGKVVKPVLRDLVAQRVDALEGQRSLKGTTTTKPRARL